MWSTPEVEGAEECTDYAFQGVAVTHLETAVLEGWQPVKKDDKVGKNWPAAPNGIRQYGEQILCKMPMDLWHKKQKAIDEYNETALSTERVQEEWYRDVDTAEGRILDR